MLENEEGHESEVVLVVDDDREVRHMLAIALGHERMTVDIASGPEEAMAALELRDYDAVVLDVMMPRRSGVTLLREIRETSDVPILMMSASDTEAMRVIALEAGADDFLGKPFAAQELALRIRLATRGRPHQCGSRSTTESRDGLFIDRSARRVSVDGEEIDLTALEFDLLACLAGSPGRVFTREELLGEVWDAEPDWQSADTVTEHIYRLRRKLPAPDVGEWIETVRGAGYRFVAQGSAQVAG